MVKISISAIYRRNIMEIVFVEIYIFEIQKTNSHVPY